MTVVFKGEFNGGAHQHFVVEYRKQHDYNWTHATSLQDTYQDLSVYRIRELKPDRKYCVRLYSINYIGRSEASERCSLGIELPGK